MIGVVKEKDVNGVHLKLSPTDKVYYHIVYNESGEINLLTHGKMNVGTSKNNLFSCTTQSEMKAFIEDHIVFLGENTLISQELKALFF